MPRTSADLDRGGESGSALVIAILITVILALLGISFLLMGETENRIAQNEKLAAQVYYVAESGARVVKRWFDYPGTAIHFPAIDEVDRDQRLILDETDPQNTDPLVLHGSGDADWVTYKETDDNLFDRPYRAGMPDRWLHTLLGTEDGPDIRIDDTDPASPSTAFLAALSETLVADFPAASAGIRARISRIDVFAPPYVNVAGSWSRYGLGTIKVVARIYRGTGAERRILAEREVQAVLGEIPYHRAYGPLHSCSDLTFTGGIGVHWGVMTADGRSKLSDDPANCVVNDCGEIPRSLPRDLPPTSRIDLLYWNAAIPGSFAALEAECDSDPIPPDPWDPWFRTISRREIEGAPGGQQPHPPASPPATCYERSNMIQNLELASCPLYDYDLWKSIATSGGADVHYYRWSSGSKFRENGSGDEISFNQITTDGEGLYFFDTTNGIAPHDHDGDGVFENLTPSIQLPDGRWSFRGFIFLNAMKLRIGNPSTGDPVVFEPPGEPFQDVDQDGTFDDGAERWINLKYPAALGDAIPVDLTDEEGGAVQRNPRGPGFTAPDVAFHGILFTNGRFEAVGRGTLYGSVIARQGVVQTPDDGSAPTPELYWDESIATGWPPAGMRLPRTVITGWVTER